MSKRRSDAELLPSISSSYRRVAEHFDRAGDGPGIGPLDALLVSLYLDFRADRIAVADLASGATRGASTLLAATRRTVRLVRIPRDDDGSVSGWRAALRDSIAELEAPCPVEPIVPGVPGSASPGRIDCEVAIVHAGGLSRREFSDRLDEAGRIAGKGPVLVLGLGPTGRCDAVAELVSRSGDGGPSRLSLFRELGGILGESGVGVLADDPDAEATTLGRISAFFSGNFDFIRLVEGVCRAAVAASQLDESTRQKLVPGNSSGGIDMERALVLLAESGRERDALRRDVDLLLEQVWQHLDEPTRREIAPDDPGVGIDVDRAKFLLAESGRRRNELRGDVGNLLELVWRLRCDVDHLLELVWRLRQERDGLTRTIEETTLVAPTPSPSITRRAVRVWRRDGVGGLLRQIHRRARVAAGPRHAGGR
ncbi:hypothetical protein [Tautonia plasticadhaerens]|uniref:Uncharacterized protein n=1 Tax=Tautonia plasticadhaerens TaxID=2527974 RepID=A0A518HFI6_9BACT|nr:hypothetical protein [Tautonia plasticadhaerens]QDV39607.1 hypothetical protein ElP_75780 [Tautonia plasticadhaerens]